MWRSTGRLRMVSRFLGISCNMGVYFAQRPKFSDPAHETRGLQPRRSRRVRCSVWLDKLGDVCPRTPLLPVTADCSQQNTNAQSKTCDQDIQKRLRREKTENSDRWQKEPDHCHRMLNGRMGCD